MKSDADRARVSEIKRGKKTETTRKFFPGYIIVNMNLLDENNQLVDKTWYFIKETDGVIGFAGTKDRPIPMRQKEVEAMLAQVREREERSSLRSASTWATRSKWPMVRSKTRTASLKRSIPSAASFASR